MADPSDGSFNLKHRLVGATVLIVIAVILLPRVLTGTAGESVRSNTDLSRAGSNIQPIEYLRTPKSNIDDREVLMKPEIEILDEDATFIKEKGAASNQPKVDSGSLIISEPIVDSLGAEGQSTSKSVVTGWIAQVGIFQVSENVNKLVSDLREDGIEAKVETIEFDGRQASRVWLGPFSTRSQAAREGYKAMMRTQSKPIVKEWP